MEPKVDPKHELGSVCQVLTVLAKRVATFQGTQNDAKVHLNRRAAGFLLLYDPFDSNGSRLGPFGSNGLMFGGCPGKAPRAEGGRREETSPWFKVF